MSNKPAWNGALGAMILCCAAGVAMLDAAEVSTEKKAKGAAPAATAPADPGWGQAEDGELRRIPISNTATLSPGPSHLAVINNEVWDLAKGQPTDVKLQGKATSSGRISANGAYLLAHSEGLVGQDGPLAVWSLETGQKLGTVPQDDRNDSVLITSEGKILVAPRNGKQLQVWDVQKLAEAPRTIDTEENIKTVAISPEGQYVAVVLRDNIAVYALATGRRAVVMDSSDRRPQVVANPGTRVGTGRPEPLSRQSNSNMVFVLAWTKSLAFSPDGKELAGIFGSSESRLIVWNRAGRVILDKLLNIQNSGFESGGLTWLPDGQGWLVYSNYLVDRKSSMVVCVLGQSRNQIQHFLDNDHLYATFSANALDPITLPWPAIRASLAAMKTNGPAYLKPGQPITIDLQLDNLRGDAKPVQEALLQAIESRLQREGISVGPAQSTRLVIRMTEAAGEALPIYERNSPFDFRGHDTGRKATESKGELVLELWADGEPKPLWGQVLRSESGRSFTDEINDQTIRKSMIEGLQRQLGLISLPTYIPKDNALATLPIYIQ